MNLNPNKSIKYVDADTGEVLDEKTFIDPELRWVRLKNGSIGLTGMYPDGEVLTTWLKQNPKPK